jgi:iron complex outermembrane recepter protein
MTGGLGPISSSLGADYGADSQRLDFDIKPQPLGSALNAYALQASQQILFTPELANGKATKGVQGALPPDIALASLLAGTGLVSAKSAEGMILVTQADSNEASAATGPSGKQLRNGSSDQTPISSQRQPLQGTSTDAADQLSEVIVTAERRSENLQNVPIAIQAFTGETLKQLNIENFDDIIKYLPNVTAAGFGPGQSNIYMRGLSTGPDYIAGNGALGAFPNVAVYLDDQSVQLPGRNLDVYSVDMERIEVLEGPQGTLFGAGAESGVIRYITNKPKIDVTEANMNLGYGYTAHGDPSSSGNGTINLPLIDNVLAVRATVYSDTRGGYINNVPGTFVRQSTDVGIHYAGYANNVPGPPTPLNSVNNSNIAANAINPVTYTGIRAGALWKINDDWNALLTQYYQNMNAEGVFYETPQTSGSSPVSLPDLSVQNYNPSDDKDRFENTALTINGRIAALNFVYSGAYLVRHSEQVMDYTNYARGSFADYYECLSPAQTGKPGQCYSPSTTWHDVVRDVHQSHEMRLSTPDDWRLRGIVGVFWEYQAVHDNADWLYRTAPGFTAIGPPPGVYANNPGIRPDDDGYFDDVTRGYHQRAAFTSIDFDIVPKTLTLTVGTRYYRFDNFHLGSAGGSFGCYDAGPPPCIVDAQLQATNARNTDDGTRSRANVTWKITPDKLVYYTFSQGFRPGSFNYVAPFSQALDYQTPKSFAPDTLTNNELGWKTEWFDRRLQLNGAVYQDKWSNVQVPFSDPQLGILGFELNGPSYRVRGVELQLVARVTHELTLTGAVAWNSSYQLDSPYLLNVKGQPITSIPNPFGQVGSPLAESPPFAGNMRARYEFDYFNEYHPFVQIGAQHSGGSHTQAGFIVTTNGVVRDFEQTPWTIYDASAGIGKDAWSVQLYCNNLTDTRADLSTSYEEAIKTITVNRPRTAGLKYSYNFGGK